MRIAVSCRLSRFAASPILGDVSDLCTEEGTMFQRVTALIACGLTLLPCIAQAQAAPPGKVVVYKGVVLKLTNVQPLDSSTAQVGDQVPLKLARALVVNGVTILPEGEMVYGRVTKVKHAGGDCRDGAVKWKVDSITFPDSTQAKAHILFAKEGPDVPVPDVEPGSDRRTGPGEILDGMASGMEGVMWFIMLAPLLIFFLPSILDQQVKDKAKTCGGKKGHEYLLPENSTVALAISRDHAVQH
jgi:hypothetical protein